MSQVSRGFIWSGVERFSIQGISFLLSILIARIVSPSSYGLIVMVQVFLSFSQLFIDGGFANALIQKKDRQNIDYYTVFIFNLLVAIIIYAFLFVAAPFIAVFYNEPQITILTRVISLNLILSSLSIVQRARLTIELDFKTQTKAGVLAVVISGIAGVICAYSGLEVWALVVQSLLSQAVISFSLIYYSKWMPKLMFSTASFRSMFNYGSKILMSNVLTGLYVNLSNLLIGKYYTPAKLAFYNRGFTLSQFPSVNVASVLHRVIFPTLSKLQDDRKQLIDAYQRYLHLSHYIILPLLCLLIVLATPLIEIVLTPKWLPAVPYLRIFSVNFMFYAWCMEANAPIAAIGKSGVLLKYSIVKRIIAFVILVITLGISVEAICWGITLSSFFELVISIYVNHKVLGTSIKTQLKYQADVFLIVAMMGILTYCFSLLFTLPLLRLILGGVFGIALYLSLTFIFNIYEKTYLLVFLKRIVPIKKQGK